jgi:hypothetical protein
LQVELVGLVPTLETGLLYHSIQELFGS